MENERPKYDGTVVYMDGKDWTVPPLSVKQFRQHFSTLTDANVNEQNVQDKLAEKLPVILAALQRNYPDLTIEQLEEMIDVATFNKCIVAISSGSGLRPSKPGE